MSDSKYVTFKLSNENYGIEIEKVSEISQYIDVIQIPNTPEYVKGIIKMREEIIPIVSLKKRLSIGDDQIEEKTRIIVIFTDKKKIGFIVDETCEVISINDFYTMNNSDEVMLHDNEYVKEIVSSEGKVITILDFNKILS